MCLGGYLGCVNCPQNQWYFIQRPPQHPVPLLGAKGTVKVMDTAAEVTIEQRFENREKQPLEVEYQFRLDAKKVAVTKFTAFIDGKKVKGILKEKEEARNTYDDAIASGHGAYLLEQKTVETFSANIGNLPPGKEVIVWITYVMELEFNDAGQLRLVLPEQKFAPNGKDTPTFPAPSTADAIANQQRVPAGLTIDVQFEMSSAISQIICESHPKAISSEIFSGDPRRATLKMPTTPNPLVEDLEILIQLEDPSKLSAIVQKNEKGESIAMVSFFPRLMDYEPLGEIIFLVDRSGSMQGTKMKRTVETMQIFLRSLSPGVKFNIVSFGSTFNTLFPDSVEYDEGSLAKATQMVASMSANMGGTEILAPLRAIFKKPADPKYPRQLFLLTDGEVSDATSCIQACKVASQSTRVFCFGIGAGASKKLVEGMAKAGGGEFEMIGDSERIDDKVLKQLGRALVPAITNVEVEWPADCVERKAPFRHAPVFQGSRVTSFVWLTQKSKLVTVKLSAVGPEGPIKFEETVDVSKPREGDYVFALAARRLMKDFEEATSYAHTQAGALQSGWSEAKIKQEMIKISLATGVMCEHTAFVAVEEREGAAQGEMVLRKVVQNAPDQGGPAPHWKAQQQQMPYPQPLGMPMRPGMSGPGGAPGGAPGRPPMMSMGGGGGYGGAVGRAPLGPMARGGGAGGAPPGAILGGMPAPSGYPAASGSYGAPGGYPPAPASYGAPAGAMPRQSQTSSSAVGGRSVSPRSTSSVGSLPPPPAPAGAAPSFDLLTDSFSSGNMASYAPPPPPPSAPASAPLDYLFNSAPAPKSSYEAPADLLSLGPASGPVGKLADSDVNKMKETILKQTAMGSWKVDDAAAALKLSAADIGAALGSAAATYVSGDKKDTALLVFATALVCVLFETKYAAEKNTWQLVVKKARTWINKQALTDVNWDSAAKSFLQAKKLI